MIARALSFALRAAAVVLIAVGIAALLLAIAAQPLGETRFGQ